MSEGPDLDLRVEAILADPAAKDNPMRPVLEELYARHSTLQRLVDRLTRISDQFQRAERDRGLSYAENYQRKVRQIERIVRISDRYQSMLRDTNERLQLISTHDELTTLPNRRFMQERINQEISQVERNGGSFVLALADIDHFKDINDTYGHAMGDRVLAGVARNLKQSLREYDVCGRWGGEEFLFLFPGCGAEEMSALADRIQHCLKSADPRDADSPRVTMSVGVTEFRRGETMDETLKRADEALYRAKSAGRDRAVVA